jgi:hypothetical protein
LALALGEEALGPPRWGDHLVTAHTHTAQPTFQTWTVERLHSINALDFDERFEVDPKV